ncbi:FAD-dependent oxidoreductase [Gammaproteobacteria bacterium]|nr:FAD-dependent oxidoreductase [Gammaproteobacteria bacterium]
MKLIILMISNKNKSFDIIILGGGFFGVSLALFLSSITKNIILIERESDILTRSSKQNQARVHSGFHYPRSAITAVKSLLLHKKFEKDFPSAIVDDFKMLYAISKHQSKVSAQRFFRMFNEMNAPIKPIKSDLFNNDYIEGVYECKETAFDYSFLKSHLHERLISSGVKINFNSDVKEINELDPESHVVLHNGKTIQGKYIFNITYGNINNILINSSMNPVKIKNELVEVALIEPPIELKDLGITVMDGPFFSTMPYPSTNNYSLSHVKYSPHETWMPQKNKTPYNILEKYTEKSNYKYMIKDALRYMPCIEDSIHKSSFYEIKSVLIKNEYNDGRPILFHQNKPDSKVISVLGGKIDNIYDLFEIIKSSFPVFKSASTNLLGEK